MQREVSPRVRPPAVAGRFYPGVAVELDAVVQRLLATATTPGSAAPKGVIAPHAGYVYSGPIAATAYASVRARAAQIEKVVLLGPAHRVYLNGLALPDADRFATPLGEVEIDRTLAAAVLELPQVIRSEQAHALEHSLEVHVPFLQALVPEFTLLPLVVGDASPAAVAEVLDRIWGGPETLIVVSSDLSHYHDYAEARRLDQATADWIASTRSPGLDPRRACGARCIDGLIEYGRRHPLALELLDLRNSGDTAGPRDQVVGYAAFAIREGACQ
ncbi:MAG TPA: AmmeMemoRadiSam system protein B [Enhygromyxa sp.]|nr:AmmeMemoRadiSam system protein B [Enhygromyxa sp.]